MYNYANCTTSKQKFEKLMKLYAILSYTVTTNNCYQTFSIPLCPNKLKFKCCQDVPKQDVGSEEYKIFMLMFIEYLG